MDALAQRNRRYWLARAYEAYALAEEMHDSVSREMMLSFARSCEELAQYAEAVGMVQAAGKHRED